jgi:flavin reductase (DIM6/NTAB) family NADH-FMN oxidoreductase RutF
MSEAPDTPEENAPAMDPDRVGPALGKLPSGVYIATGTIGGEDVGMLASFVEQAGFDPPMVSAAISRGRRLGEALEDNGMLGINILGEDDGALMKPFVQPDNEQPFAALSTTFNDHHLPQLDDALGFLACKVVGKVDREGADHIVYVAEVLDGELHDDSRAPMVRIRKNGFQY